MGLKDFQVPRDELQLPGGGSFTVRGLSYIDMRLLFNKHAAEMAAFFDLLSKGREQGQVAIEDAAVMAASMLNTAPALAADVIATAADEPDAFETVLLLPFPVQTEALSKIGRLTFGTEGAAKKFLQTVNALFLSLKGKPKG